MPHLSDENRRQICLEEAQLAWGSCRGSHDKGTTSLARNLLRSLLKELQTLDNGKQLKISFRSVQMLKVKYFNHKFVYLLC